MFMLGGQTRQSTRDAAVVALLSGQVIRGLKALEHYIGEDGFAVSGRLTMADCTLVPALFLIENVLPTVGLDNPIPKAARRRRKTSAIVHAARRRRRCALVRPAWWTYPSSCAIGCDFPGLVPGVKRAAP